MKERTTETLTTTRKIIMTDDELSDLITSHLGLKKGRATVIYDVSQGSLLSCTVVSTQTVTKGGGE